MIQPIIFEYTENTPEIILDQENNVFKISGRSIVENAHEFYEPVLQWFKDYFKQPNESTELILYLEYLNSSSSLQIMKIISLFEHNNTETNHLKIVWISDKEDELSKERGEELMNITNIYFELIESNFDYYEDFNFDI
jgi:hypothetical protein